MRRALLIALLTALPGLARAQTLEAPPPPWALIEMPRDGTTRAALPLVVRGLDVEGGTVSTIRAEARPPAIAALRALGVAVTVLAPDVAGLRPTSTGARGPTYHSPSEVTELLTALAADRPDVVRLIDLGRSVEGRPLTGVLLTDEPDRRELDEPSIRFLGTHHGDEWSSMEVAVAAIQELVDRYPEDPAVATLLDHTEVWALPVVNPDGVVDFRRRNANGVDLNRNYDHPGFQPGGAAGPAPFSEPESASVRALSMTRAFHHGITLHSGAVNIGWPWNWTIDPALDGPLMEPVAVAYADRNTTSGFWITQGGEWYLTFGDLNDWSLDTQGTHDFTLEVTLEKAPDEDEIPAYVDEHLEATLAFLTADGVTGVRGRVTDPEGRGLEAMLLSDPPGTATWTDPETGAYAKRLGPGETVLDVVAPGFAPAQVTLQGGPGDTLPWQTVDLQLERVDPIEIDWIVGREAPLDGGDLCLAGRDVLEVLGLGGRVLLQRPFFSPAALDLDVDPECVTATLDPERLGPPHRRRGEWTLLIEDVDGAVRAHLPLAVLLAETGDADLVVEPTDEADVVRVTVVGEDLPSGALLRFSGPAAERALPLRRELEADAATSLSATVDIGGWALGLWSLRVFGGGSWTAFPDRLERTPEGLVAVEVPGDDDDVGDDDDSTVADDDDSAAIDDDDAGPDPTPDPPPDEEGGCEACSSSYAPGASPGFLLLPLALRRRRRSC